MNLFIASAKWLGSLAVVVFITVAAPLLVLLALPLMKKDKANIFPAWLQWLNTYDDLGCDQGMYEPHVKWVNDHLGWYVKTWYWLGLRNSGYGLMWLLAPTFDISNAALKREGVHGVGSWRSTLVLPSGTYFERGWSGNWSATKKWTFGFGWKLFSIEHFFAGAVPGPLDRPLFYLQLKPFSTFGMEARANIFPLIARPRCSFLPLGLPLLVLLPNQS